VASLAALSSSVVDAARAHGGTYFGYTASKHVAERVVVRAAAGGAPSAPSSAGAAAGGAPAAAAAAAAAALPRFFGATLYRFGTLGPSGEARVVLAASAAVGLLPDDAPARLDWPPPREVAASIAASVAASLARAPLVAPPPAAPAAPAAPPRPPAPPAEAARAVHLVGHIELAALRSALADAHALPTRRAPWGAWRRALERLAAGAPPLPATAACGEGRRESDDARERRTGGGGTVEGEGGEGEGEGGAGPAREALRGLLLAPSGLEGAWGRCERPLGGATDVLLSSGAPGGGGAPRLADIITEYAAAIAATASQLRRGL